MNYCYKYFSTYLSWSNSSSLCKNQGAQLLAIHNATQESYIETIYKSQIGMQDSLVWIGLRYFKLENPSYWGWSDGTLLGYAKWLSDDNYNECGAIQVLRNQNGWKSVSCDAKLPYICYQKAVEF
uniref:C-type lectin domain-containing protein n=1 Tax=Panagrolaimus superbus TaxID=310955 RepID=A0A914ZA32_9BILA